MASTMQEFLDNALNEVAIKRGEQVEDREDLSNKKYYDNAKKIHKNLSGIVSELDKLMKIKNPSHNNGSQIQNLSGTLMRIGKDIGHEMYMRN